MEEFKTFSIKSRTKNVAWLFKYNVDGTLYSYTILSGVISVEQARWLFMGGRFPICVEDMFTFKKNFAKFFLIEETNPEMNFAYFWTTYDKKALKKQALEFWKKKMNEKERILAIVGIRKYKEYCQKKRQDLQDPIRYLRNKRYED